MSDKKSALIVWGGWDGHDPEAVAEVFRTALVGYGFDVKVSDALTSFEDSDYLKSLSLIVPVWTMGKIERAQSAALAEAVKSGVGLAGCHGGMCDSFRDDSEYQFMTGGQFVAHPGNDGTDYTVKIIRSDHFITLGSPEEFQVSSEQYYMHVDPAIKVLATTRFPVADGPHLLNGDVEMPVIWTKFYGQGRVAYNSLGHNSTIVKIPVVENLMTRAMLWVAHAEDLV